MHSFVLLAQAITLSTCIIAHNNALLALLVSNNFAEIKSNVFKKVSKENLHNLVYYGECAYDCVISMILNQMVMDDCICYVSTVWMIDPFFFFNLFNIPWKNCEQISLKNVNNI